MHNLSLMKKFHTYWREMVESLKVHHWKWMKIGSQSVAIFGQKAWNRCAKHGKTSFWARQEVAGAQNLEQRHASSHYGVATYAINTMNNRELSPIPEFDYYNADDEEDSTAKLLAKLTNSDLAFEWSMLCQDCTDCWSMNGKST